MFERYNEKARRAIFFARAEASELGCEQIEADFLLLGIARESPSLAVHWLGANYGELRETADRLYARGKEIPTSVDMPLSNLSKRVLAYAGEEAERLTHKWIGTEHLFLGLLREPDTLAAKMLAARGGDITAVRASVAADEEPDKSTARVPAPASLGTVRVSLQEEDKTIALAMWRGRIPGIGEAVTIPDDAGDEVTYRIRDVIWHAKGEPTPILIVAEISIKVQRENP